MNIVNRSKIVLRKKVAASDTNPIDDRGYWTSPEMNLVPGVTLASVEADLQRGDGNELRAKFAAIHSSCALAVNSFGIFKDQPENLQLFGRHGADVVEFEKQLKIFRGGRPPNIDVWIERDEEIVAVESKFLEYLTPKIPSFSKAYDRLQPTSENAWWQAYEEAKCGKSQHLDRAQIIKHYFGLNAFSAKGDTRRITLLYLFWEPLNGEDIPECIKHREELSAFANSVKNARICFDWMSYNQLWEEWTMVPALTVHSRNLVSRYQVHLSS